MISTLLFRANAGALAAKERLRLSTTTSTENSGLLAVLIPPFEARYGLQVDVIPVGTGKALKLAEGGDVDVTLVHAPELEEQFVKQGFGVNRRYV
ncbi:MAG: substrate-binding domain-containing protein, partial [Candidatus Methylomirabilales bacterium]